MNLYDETANMRVKYLLCSVDLRVITYALWGGLAIMLYVM
jgi:hypothetical protein